MNKILAPLVHSPLWKALAAMSLALILISQSSCYKREPEPVAPQPPKVTHFQVGVQPVAIASDGTDIWIANVGDDTVMKLRSDGGVLGIYSVPKQPVAIAYGGGYIWVASSESRKITRLTLSGQTVGVISIEREPSSVLWWRGFIWVVNSQDNSILRVSPSTREVITTRVGKNPRGIAVAGDYLLVACQGDSTLVKMGVEANILDTYTVYSAPSPLPSAEGNDGPSALAVVGDKTWLIYPRANALVPVDKNGMRTGFFTGPGQPGAIAEWIGSLWMTDFMAGTVTRYNLAGLPLVTFPVGNRPVAIINDRTSLWVANEADNSVARIDPN